MESFTSLVILLFWIARVVVMAKSEEQRAVWACDKIVIMALVVKNYDSLLITEQLHQNSFFIVFYLRR